MLLGSPREATSALNPLGEKTNLFGQYRAALRLEREGDETRVRKRAAHLARFKNSFRGWRNS